MTLEKLTERSIIKFPRLIHLEEAEKILEYLAKNLPANIHYKASYDKSLTYFVDTLEKRDGNSNLSAHISGINENFAYEVVEFQQSKINDKFLSLKFQTVPGWNSSYYRLEIKQFWDKTKKVINNYFLKKNLFSV